MKVFFVMDALINAGTEKSTLDILRHFSGQVRVELVYFYPRHELKDAYEEAGIPLHFLNLKGKTDFRKGIKQLTKLIREHKPDLVVSSILRANLMARVACYRTKTKLIGTFVSDSYNEDRQTSFSLKRKIGASYYYWLDRFTAFIPAAWISNSNSIRITNCRALKVPTSKVEVIYRGRDAAQFPAWAPVSDGGRFTFVFIGRLLQTKGLEELVTAMATVKQLYPNVVLDVYGEGSHRATIEQLVRSLQLEKEVRLHGNVIDGWKKLYEADCFVFPSWYEGFSGALVEAMMSGIPIIASAIPMNLEAVQQADTALVHIPGDASDLTRKMLHLLNRYYRMPAMGHRARKTAIEKFDVRKVAHQYESFLVEQASTTIS